MFNGVGDVPSNPNDLGILSKSSSPSTQNNNNNNGLSQKDKSSEITSNSLTTFGDTTPLFLKDSNNEQFIADHFLILARPVIKPKRGSGGTIEYGAYWATQVNGSNARVSVIVFFLSGKNQFHILCNTSSLYFSWFYIYLLISLWNVMSKYPILSHGF